MVEIVGTLTAVGLLALAARFVGDARHRLRLVWDEMRFRRDDRVELNRRFARVLGEQSPF